MMRRKALSSGRETIWARAIASQKLSRDRGEPIFAARHHDVSQGPLGALLQKLVGGFYFFKNFGEGNLAGHFVGFFRTHKLKAQKLRAKFRSVFCGNI